MINVKKQFPVFKHQPDLSYLDSASTTQTPKVVLDAMNDYYTKYRANVHRGVYTLSVQATEQYENAREIVAEFINAEPAEIIFSSGATFSLNQLCHSLSPRLSHRDNVVLTRMEHHANLVPWQQMAKHYGFELRFIELTKSPLEGGFVIDLASARKLIDANTKIVSFSLASNVLGTVTPAEEIIKLAKRQRAITIIDAAQAAGHMPIDVKKLDCDFLTFSGHKMYGPTGSGVLYGKKVLLEEHLEPFLFGGEMVTEVTYGDATWNEVPWKFEAGTQNIAGAIGLGAAVKFIKEIGWETIQKHENELTNKLISELTVAGVKIIGPAAAGNRLGVVSFVIPGVHPHDVAEILSQENICVRAGQHCAMPLMKHLRLESGTVRASIGLYTTEEDIEKLMRGVEKAKKIFL